MPDRHSDSQSWAILPGDCRETMAELKPGSVQTCVTSPPYLGLRSYGVEPSIWGDSECGHEWGDAEAVRETTYGGKTRWQHVHNGRGEEQESRADREGWLRSVVEQGRYCTRGCGAWLGCLGLEPTPEQFTANMVEIFRAVRRVLRDDGTVWLNLGDSYAGSSQSGGDGATSTLTKGGKVQAQYGQTHAIRRGMGDAKPKDLLGIPWMVAFALRADGWYLRSDIIWHKPNPMPESITDRPTKAHEYLFLLSKSARYFYDAEAIRETDSGSPSGNGFAGYQGGERDTAVSGGRGTEEKWTPGGGRNKRSVWTIPTQPFPGAHFATFPTKLIEPCIIAACPERACSECGAPWKRAVERYDTGERQKMADGWDTGEGGHGAFHRDGRQKGEPGVPVMATRTVGWEPTCSHDAATTPGVVLDPFAGSGTTAMVALRHGRSFVGCELNPEYLALARDRIIADSPLLNTHAEAA